MLEFARKIAEFLGRQPTAREAVPDQVREVVEFLSTSRILRLEDYQIAGTYYRFRPQDWQYLRQQRDRVLRPFKEKNYKKNNFLIWAPPGTGKTSLATEIGAMAKRLYGTCVPEVLDLKKKTLDDVNIAIVQYENLLTKHAGVLVIVDECDQHFQHGSAFEILHGPVDWNWTDGRPIVWIFAGSGRTVEELLTNMGTMNRSGDVISRIQEPYIIVPPLTLGDRIIIAAGHAVQSGFLRAERSALMRVALDPALRTSRAISAKIEGIAREVRRDVLSFTDFFVLSSQSSDAYERERAMYRLLDSRGPIEIVPPKDS